MEKNRVIRLKRTGIQTSIDILFSTPTCPCAKDIYLQSQFKSSFELQHTIPHITCLVTTSADEVRDQRQSGLQ